ncbi:rhomboid family intramembrane serine protease [Yoonia sp. R2331]|uniref:rhomboid family intramembrane serine protease n=1 Tax=Yoonia sp. R2331 TaxID=3237238 RepID=UPI0034E4D875
MENQSPVNPIPPVVIVLCLIAVLVELVLSAGQFGVVADRTAIGWRINALQDYSVSPAVLEWMHARGDYAPEMLMRFLTYPFVHASFTQALFGAALLLALGKFVGDALGNLAVLVVFLATSIGGAIVFCLIASGTTPLFGLFPPVYGLIGAYTYVIWLHLGRTGQSQLAAFRLIGFLLALQLVFGLLFGAGNAWIAELAGFVFGFAVATLLVPGGWAALVQRLRQRS